MTGLEGAEVMVGLAVSSLAGILTIGPLDDVGCSTIFAPSQAKALSPLAACASKGSKSCVERRTGPRSFGDVFS